MNILNAFPLVLDLRKSDYKESAPPVSALHSGNMGDIIYSLPTCDLLGVNHYIINICSDPAFLNRTISERSARALAPLLLAQKNLSRVSVVKSNVPWESVVPKDIGVNYVLDTFRLNFANPKLHLLYQHALPYNLHVDGSKPWMLAESFPGEEELPNHPYLVVALTPRYRRFPSSYYEELLKNIPPEAIYFVGTEFDQIERMNIAGVAYQTEDFRNLARLIAGASLFIGNPSFAYALAEALKVKRYVGLADYINVYPLDARGEALHLNQVAHVKMAIYEALGMKESAKHLIYQLQDRIEDLSAENQQLMIKNQIHTKDANDAVEHMKYLVGLHASLKYHLRQVLFLVRQNNRVFNSFIGFLKKLPGPDRVWRTFTQV